MKSLDEYKLSTRIITTVILILVILAVLSFIGWISGGWEAQGQAREQSVEPSLILTLPPTKWDGKLLELDKQALDEAYIAKVKQLFDVWVREGLSSDEGAMKGHAQAQRAYLKAQRAVEIKEKILEERGREQQK